MDRRFALLLACFFLSGFAALLYQTAWTRELSFVFGTSELAVAAVLAAYMAGLALGAGTAARLAHRVRRPVLVYGLLELGIALSALSVPLGIRLISHAYFGLLGGRGDLIGSGSAGPAIFQLAASFLVLLPPTALMGATLPLLARHAVRNESEIGSRVGILYAINTAGAILGTLTVAFWLMPAIGLRQTVWVGAAINGLVFGLAALLSRTSPPALAPRTADATPHAQPQPRSQPSAATPNAWVLPLMLLSGAVSFTYEVLWTRLLGHMLGASLDAFATMLASFLLGIAVGSAFAARWATTVARAAWGFAVAQVCIALTSYAAFAVADRLPEMAARLGAGPGAPLASAALAAATLIPITFCIGTTFPLAVRLVAGGAEQAASATARAYAWNTVGAIAGALASGFVLLPMLGFAGTVNAGVITSLALAAITALLVRPRLTGLLAMALAVAVLAVVFPARPPWMLLRSSPLSQRPAAGPIVFSAVGRSATVMLFDEGDHFLLTTNGLPEAKPQRRGMLPVAGITHWLGMLPSLLRPGLDDLLVIGLGGATVLEPVPSSVGSIDVIELEPEVIEANLRIQHERSIDPLSDPRLRILVGDARGLMQLTGRKYDAIVSQPSHPWTAGASHLYTREFFDLARTHLDEEGVFIQWIGLAYLDEALLRSLAATLRSVFTHVEIYQPLSVRGLLFVASESQLTSIERIERALAASPDDFRRFGLERVEDVMAARVLDDDGCRNLAEGGAINTDDHNLLAARASRLGDTALQLDQVRAIWKRDDPLLGDTTPLARDVLLRALVATAFKDRASDIALESEGARQELDLGWVERGLGRPARARRHFERAASLEPGLDEAFVGLVALGVDAPTPPESGRDPRIAALLAGRASAARADWAAVAELDDELAGFEYGHALFDEATRLRVHARLARGDAAAAAEAQRLIEGLLVRLWNPDDALLRARAALAAGHPEDAWGALVRIAQAIRRRPRLSSFRSPALELARTLPEPLRLDCEARLAPPGTATAASGRTGDGSPDDADADLDLPGEAL